MPENSVLLPIVKPRWLGYLRYFLLPTVFRFTPQSHLKIPVFCSLLNLCDQNTYAVLIVPQLSFSAQNARKCYVCVHVKPNLSIDLWSLFLPMVFAWALCPPCFPIIMILWLPVIIKPWIHKNMRPCRPDVMSSWFHDDRATWKPIMRMTWIHDFMISSAQGKWTPWAQGPMKAW